MKARVPWRRPYWAAEAMYEEDIINNEAGKELQLAGNDSPLE